MTSYDMSTIGRWLSDRVTDMMEMDGVEVVGVDSSDKFDCSSENEDAGVNY